MSCVCSKQLSAVASSLRKLPMAMLASLAKDQLGPLNVVARLAPQVCVALNATAAATATGTATAAVSASASISADAVARLEALASVHANLALGALTPTAALRMNTMISSANQQLPDVLAALNEFLEPASAALDQLQAAIASLQGIQALTGRNLTLPNAAFQIPSASASAGASASASANASATLNATAHAMMSANAMMAMRINAVAVGLGFPLPAKIAGLDAALRLTAGLPPVNLPASLLHAISSKISALAATAQLLGGNLASPNASMLLNAALASAQANLTAMVSGTVTGVASLQASTAVSAAANAAAGLNANAILSAAANLSLSAVPNLQPLAVSLNLSANLQSLTGTPMFASTPCASCAYKF